jgi:hypothetical protein
MQVVTCLSKRLRHFAELLTKLRRPFVDLAAHHTAGRASCLLYSLLDLLLRLIDE